MPKHTFRTLLIVISVFITSSYLFGQLEEEKFYYGFSAGLTYSNIADIQTTLIRPEFPENTYSTNSKQSTGAVFGGFVYYKFAKSKLAIQPEINFSKQGGGFHYEDIEDLNYDINFNYSFLNISPILKFYTVHGLNVAAGVQLGIITNRSALTYTSNQPSLGPDLQIQQNLRQVLKGNNNVAVVLGVGYDTPFGLNVNARWVYGVSDAVETLANGFYFIENKNSFDSFQITVGYHIPFFND